jgi:uncharacterized membrane protein
MNVVRLYLLGFVLVVAGVLILALGSLASGSGSVGGVVFIGPFPVVFGSGPGSGAIELTALIIAAVMVVTFYLFILLRRGRWEAPG